MYNVHIIYHINKTDNFCSFTIYNGFNSKIKDGNI